MKDNSISGLRINQTLIIVSVLMTVGISSQIITNQKQYIKVAKEENVKIIEQIELGVNNNERTEKVTSRSLIERPSIEEMTIEESEENDVEQPKYKKVEEIVISKDMDLTQRCGISKEDFIELMTNLNVDSSGFFERNAETIYDLCEEYELNEVFFCGLIAAESGWNIASNHQRTHNYISMMSNGGLIKFESDEAGLEAAAKLLHNRYLTPGGSYYRGTTLASVQKIFCPNSTTWVGLVFGCMKQVLK